MAYSTSPQQTDSAPSILLVEDSDDDAYFFQRAIRKTGIACAVQRVANGRTAIEMLTQALKNNVSTSRLPNLVFLDLKMPVVSGFDVLQWLQKAAITPPLNVIVLSGSDDHADHLRAKQLGASDYLVKPICAAELAARLSRAIGQPRVNSELEES